MDYEHIRKLSDLLIINSGKINGLEHDKMLGILDRETQKITTAEVQHAVLFVIEQLPNHFWNHKISDRQHSFRTQLIKSIELLHKDTKSKFAYDIFICFSTKDRAIAQPIWETFRGYGLRVFVSDEDLQNTVGFNFLDEIDKAISNSQHLVLLASNNALQSTFVRDEYQSFYSDCHVKSPEERLLIVYRLKNFQINDLPRILKTKQIANSTEQIISTLISEDLIKQNEINRSKEVFVKKEKINHVNSFSTMDLDEIQLYEKFSKLIESDNSKNNSDIADKEDAELRTQKFLEKQNLKITSEKSAKEIGMPLAVALTILGSIIISIIYINADKNHEEGLFVLIFSAIFTSTTFSIIFYQIVWRIVYFIKITNAK